MLLFMASECGRDEVAKVAVSVELPSSELAVTDEAGSVVVVETCVVLAVTVDLEIVDGKLLLPLEDAGGVGGTRAGGPLLLFSCWPNAAKAKAIDRERQSCMMLELVVDEKIEGRKGEECSGSCRLHPEPAL